MISLLSGDQYDLSIVTMNAQSQKFELRREVTVNPNAESVPRKQITLLAMESTTFCWQKR